MGYDYDALYQSTPQALGAPTQVFVDFFDALDSKPARVLDVGCGQGRDALFIARLGHSVVGVDLSPSGISELQSVANEEGLAIEGIATDINSFTPDGLFDIVLIDRTLHMLPEKERLSVLKRLIMHVSPNGWVLIADEASNMAGFKAVFAGSDVSWRTTLDGGGSLFLQRM